MKKVDKDIQKAVEYLSTAALVTKTFPNASVDYCADSGMLYIDDRATGEPLAVFHVDQADIRTDIDGV